MRQTLLPFTLSLAVLLAASVLAQDQVQIQFQVDPLEAQTGSEAVFTVLTVSQILSMTWIYQGVTLGLWSGGAPTINPVAQFQGRVTISATQLRIGGAQLRDAGEYRVEVTPIATTGLSPNSRSIQLSVFDAVDGVSLTVPSVAVETRNVSLQCTWTAGTDLTVQWGRDGAAVATDSRVTISGGSLVFNPARRSDSGDYSCTVSNPVSVQSVTRTLTVFYGPDNPVLTKDVPKDCVGDGDVEVGQTARLTCTSDSLPAAQFSWQRDGRPVSAGQPESGVLSVQTFSTDESARYVCIATNRVTGDTSEQGTLLTIVDVCLSVGEVVGIVIGSLLLLLIIALLIWLIVFLVRRRRRERRRERDTVYVPKNDREPRPIPPDPEPNGARDLGQGPHIPVYHMNTHTRNPERLYTAPRQQRDSPHTLRQNGLHNSHTQQHNGRTHTNNLNSIQNTNSYPHNGIDNPAFTHTDAQNVNTLPNTQQQNPNILIQAGTAQGGAQPPAVHVSLNTLPQTAQQHNNAQMPTIHVNLNSYPTNGQQPQQDRSFPLTNTVNDNALQTQQDFIHRGQSNPRMQSGQSYNSDPRLNGVIEAGRRDEPGLIPTGHTHHHSRNTSQRDARTQTLPQELVPHSRSDRNSGRNHDTTASSTRQQMPWDRLQGTPAYPLQRGRTPPEYTSDTSAYTTHPPIRDARTPSRSRSRSRSPDQTISRRRTPPRRDPPSENRHPRSRSADRVPSAHSAVRLEAAHHTQSSPRTQRERAQPDIRGLPTSQSAPRQEATHSYNPQAVQLMIQQASVGPSAVSHRPAVYSAPVVTQRGLNTPQGADTRALADPNHLPQAHMAPQQREAPIQNTPHRLGTQTQPVINGASQPSQGGSAPVAFSPAQHNPSNLTQAALTEHTERAKTFQNRKQQTQAALLQPGPQARAPAVGTQQAPIPPPVIPLAQFQTLPKKHAQHRSPIRGPEPPRPPVNIPVAQRPQGHHRPHATLPAHHHHQPGRGHVHVSPHRHANGHGNPAHFTHPRQQQAHRERPR